MTWIKGRRIILDLSSIQLTKKLDLFCVFYCFFFDFVRLFKYEKTRIFDLDRYQKKSILWLTEHWVKFIILSYFYLKHPILLKEKFLLKSLEYWLKNSKNKIKPFLLYLSVLYRFKGVFVPYIRDRKSNSLMWRQKRKRIKVPMQIFTLDFWNNVFARLEQFGFINYINSLLQKSWIRHLYW